MPSSTASSLKNTNDVMNRLKPNVKLLKEAQLCTGYGETGGGAGEGAGLGKGRGWRGAGLGAETQVHRGFWTISELLGRTPSHLLGQAAHPGPSGTLMTQGDAS